jgi:hypothetical protein
MMMVANEPGTRAALVSKRVLLIASSQPETRPSVNVFGLGVNGETESEGIAQRCG